MNGLDVIVSQFETAAVATSVVSVVTETAGAVVVVVGFPITVGIVASLADCRAACVSPVRTEVVLCTFAERRISGSGKLGHAWAFFRSVEIPANLCRYLVQK